MRSNKLFWVFLFIVSLNFVHAKGPILRLPNDDSLVLKDYLTVHQSFFKKTCSPGLEGKYYRLLRQYRGNGYYLPEIDEKIDIETIKKFIPLLRLKRRWTSEMAKKLSEMKRWPYYKSLTANVVESLKKAHDLKKKYYLAVKQEQKELIKEESIKELERLKSFFNIMLKKIPFFLGFQHPVDHLLNRRNYADLKDSQKKEDIVRANEVFFLRRILEDGALDPNHTRPDKFLRSTIDTISLAIPKMEEFVEERVRYDIDYILRGIKKQLRRGRRAHLRRFKSWEKRVLKTLLFYKKIIQNDKVAQTGKLNENDKIMAEKLKANKALKEFIYEKQKETYLFWIKQNKRNKALFALETILYNEVGVVDGKDALERKDVARVVRNRVFAPEYRYIPKTQDLYDYLAQHLSDEEIQKEYWLNVLFKKGEFSFTYFYISGVVKIFCPDMSSRGKYLRRKNLRIAMNTLKSPMDSFDAVRYFSRSAMNGRIDMSSVWHEFEPLPERPGLKKGQQKWLRSQYLSDSYLYLYSFKNDDRVYQVLKIKDQIVVMSWQDKKPIFFKYRNPHHFKYFSPSSS